MHRRVPLRRIVACVLAAFLVSGCASLSRDHGFDTVQRAVKERTGADVQWVRNEAEQAQALAASRKLLAELLTPEAAVQVALLSNRALRSVYADLGIAEADLVQAGRLRNPGFSYARLRRGDDLEIERTFLLDVLGLLTMPIRTDLERRRFAITQTRVASEVLQVAADTRRAYYRAVAAQESARYAEQVKESAEASAELARRMAAVGNFSKLDHAREQVFYAEATAQLARTRQNAVAARERLVSLMGLSGEDIRFTLPERLPDLPASTRDAAELERTALTRRLDLASAIKEAESLAASLGLTQVRGFISVLEVGYARNSETHKPHQTGYEIELRLPIFDWGNARVARAEYTYMQAVNRAADLAVRAQSELRETYSAYRTAYELARHYRDEIIPLRKSISEENLLRYNGMLISVFELLADARQQIGSVNSAIDALRDFWIAEVNLELASSGHSPRPAQTGGPSPGIGSEPTQAH